MKISIASAEEKDDNRLTQIAFGAKSYWNYPEEYMKLWKDDLTITAEYIRKNTVLKAVDEQGEILGFGTIEFSKIFNAEEIGHMWVQPSHMGEGIGRQILNALINHARKAGIKKLYAISDPNAQGFYEKSGFVLAGKQESQPVGRYLPVLILNIQ